jgi:hypothetical protein
MMKIQLNILASASETSCVGKQALPKIIEAHAKNLTCRLFVDPEVNRQSCYTRLGQHSMQYVERLPITAGKPNKNVMSRCEEDYVM